MDGGGDGGEVGDALDAPAFVEALGRRRRGTRTLVAAGIVVGLVGLALIPPWVAAGGFSAGGLAVFVPGVLGVGLAVLAGASMRRHRTAELAGLLAGASWSRQEVFAVDGGSAWARGDDRLVVRCGDGRGGRTVVGEGPGKLNGVCLVTGDVSVPRWVLRTPAGWLVLVRAPSSPGERELCETRLRFFQPAEWPKRWW